jgi:competence protein ComGC
MRKLVRFVIPLLLLITIKSVYAVKTSADNADDSISMQKIFDEEQRENYIIYKNEQNSLSDNQREKALYKNQYWLVNKEQEL